MRNRDLEDRFVEKGMWNKGFQVNKLGTCKTRIWRRGLQNDMRTVDRVKRGRGYIFTDIEKRKERFDRPGHERLEQA